MLRPTCQIVKMDRSSPVPTVAFLYETRPVKPGLYMSSACLCESLRAPLRITPCSSAVTLFCVSLRLPFTVFLRLNNKQVNCTQTLPGIPRHTVFRKTTTGCHLQTRLIGSLHCRKHQWLNHGCRSGFRKGARSRRGLL